MIFLISDNSPLSSCIGYPCPFGSTSPIRPGPCSASCTAIVSSIGQCRINRSLSR
ncbi:hypothetical protein BDD12DRAFT_103797 [Trichophaea hybrida]|nr:hypothetical protein BDD12DRAFT_103797 [Trichophaea hybrida]